jgi:predicted transcriptional regulator
MTTVSFYLDDKLNERLGSIAESSERSKSFIIRKAVEYFIATYKSSATKSNKGRIPNAKTRKAIDDARKGKNLTKIDDFSEFLKTL